MYTEMIKAREQEGKQIKHALGVKYEKPPERHHLPISRLLNHAFQLDNTAQYADYYQQIMSTFGEVLKMDCTRKVIIITHLKCAIML